MRRNRGRRAPRGLRLAVLMLLLGACLSLPVAYAADPAPAQAEESALSSLEEERVLDRLLDLLDRLQAAIREDIDIERTVQAMSQSEKIHQLFILEPEALLGGGAVTAAGEKFQAALTEHPVGGLIFFGANLQSEEQTRAMLTEMETISRTVEGAPLFLCVDEEGGRVARVAGSGRFDVTNVGAMQTVDSLEKARQSGSYVGSYLHELGFNVDLAPVADVLTVEGNTVIDDRSFGSDPAEVTRLAAAFSKGLQEQGILSTYKHFPGNGSTVEDPHVGMASTNKTLEELKKQDLVPFAGADQAGVDIVMIAHVTAPEVTGDDTPASLSRVMVTDILRDELGYDGLTVTDALSMGAIVQHYGTADAAVRAVQAGVDLLLMPADFSDALAGVTAAVDDGRISQDRLTQSVKRIQKAKRRLASR